MRARTMKRTTEAAADTMKMACCQRCRKLKSMFPMARMRFSLQQITQVARRGRQCRELRECLRLWRSPADARLTHRRASGIVIRTCSTWAMK